MIVTITLFVISLILSCIIIYTLSYLWHTDSRNRQVQSLFILGLDVVWWLFMNAICMVVQPQFFPFVYTLAMLAVCVFPAALLWFFLHFIRARIVGSKPFQYTLIGCVLLDVLALITNPLHHLFYVDYGYPLGTFGPLFWVHSILSYIAIIVVFMIMIWLVLRQPQYRIRFVLMILLLIATCLMNVLFNMHILDLPHDLTPIGFCCAFILYAYISFKSQMFTFRTTALTRIFDSIAESIIITTPDGIIVDTNRSFNEAFDNFEFMSGRTSIRDFSAFLDGDFQPLHDLGTDAFRPSEFTFRQDTIKKTYSITQAPITKNNRLTGYSISLSDVSDYRAMIEEINIQNERLVQLKDLAESASAAKGNFLASMSHEMRTPMNAIIGMTELAEQEQDPAKIPYYIDRIKNASHHLLGVINNVLDMAKIESGKMELSSQDTNIRDVFEQITVVAGYGAKEKDQNLLIDIDPSIPPYIYVDEQHLSQVLTNLLANAIKFTPKGGCIQLKAQMIDHNDDVCSLQFSVIDNGIGINDEQQKRLFQPFEQADTSTSRQYGGTGLGLAISKSIVELMGGQIILTSSPGSGSTFTFTISVPIAKGNDAEAICEEQPEHPDFSHKTILMAEDVAINREILMALLKDTHVAIDIAENGLEAVSKFEKHPDYDMIFMDIQMPEMDGYEATKRIRALPLVQAKTVPIVAMTANVFKEDIEKSLAAGMNSHISKPININEVLKTMERYLT